MSLRLRFPGRSIHGPHGISFVCDAPGGCGRDTTVARGGRVDMRSWSINVATPPSRWQRRTGGTHLCDRCVRR